MFYGALAKKDDSALSKTLKTTENFFRKVLWIFIVYIIVLMFIYPYLMCKEFSAIYTITLIAIISISTIMQYFFGISRQLLIQADQKTYIINISRTITCIFNAIVVIVLANMNASIHLLKLLSALVYTISPLMYYIYVKKKYDINNNCKTDKTILDKRWDGFAHHIAYFLHTNVGITALTIFSTMKEISVYSIYILIINGLKNIINIFSSSISAIFGSMLAAKENIKEKYIAFDYANMLITFLLYTIAGITIIQFIKVYTIGIEDTNYCRPLFAILLIIAEGLYTLRCSYTMIIYAAGHFRETKRDSYIEAILNIVISFALVRQLGIIGVAIGLLVAMGYRTVSYIIYLSKNIVYWDVKNIIKKYLINILATLIIISVSSFIPNDNISNFIEWGMYALIVGIIALITYLITNYMFCGEEVRNIYKLYIKGIIVRMCKK